jgi:hypothetical protein
MYLVTLRPSLVCPKGSCVIPNGILTVDERYSETLQINVICMLFCYHKIHMCMHTVIRHDTTCISVVEQ